jgi:hypothetical protein
MLLGRVSYWDPFFALAKLFIPLANSVSQAPFIRSGAMAANYRFTPNVEWYANGFIGSDGVGAAFEYENDAPRMKTISDMKFLWDNLQGFLTTGVVVNPTNAMVLKTSIGAGFLNSNIEAKMNNTITVRDKEGIDQEPIPVDNNITQDKINSNYQLRLDYDWDLGKGFLFAAGVQERFNIWNQNMLTHLMQEFIDFSGSFQMKEINIDREMTNRGINSSAYSLVEYHNDDWRFDAELGLRVDHVYFIGENPDKSSFAIQTFPAFNPRLNLDFGLLEDVGIIETLSLTAGSGLFSAMNKDIQFMEGRKGIDDFEMKQDRAWTSVIGTKIDFVNDISFNIEGYYKYIFNRAYTTSNITTDVTEQMIINFDGQAYIVGFDLILQKYESRYWDGWISYSFNYARYKDPATTGQESSVGNFSEP